MTTVKKIVKTEHHIPKETLSLCDKLGVLKYIPTTVPVSLSFELHNTTTAFANAIRRCINSEIDILALTFDDNDMTTNDNFLITHDVRSNINMIPIRQVMGSVYHVNVVNTTDVIMPVYSHHIKVRSDEKTRHGDARHGGDEEMFAKSIIITYLRPGKFLKIKNISAKSGVAYRDGAAHSCAYKVQYKCIHPDCFESSSLNSSPSTYELTIPWQKYIDPAYLVKSAVKVLLSKLNRIYTTISENKSDKFFSPDLEIMVTKGVGSFRLINETYTIGYLITAYVTRVDPTITNTHCIKPHPSYNYVIVNITHSEPHAIILKAISMVRVELQTVHDAF